MKVVEEPLQLFFQLEPGVIGSQGYAHPGDSISTAGTAGSATR
jgi:hypothetical protein